MAKVKGDKITKRNTKINTNSKLHFNHLLSPPEYIFRFLGLILIPVCALGGGMSVRSKIRGQWALRGRRRGVAELDVKEKVWRSEGKGMEGGILQGVLGKKMQEVLVCSSSLSALNCLPRLTCFRREENISWRSAAQSRSASPRLESPCHHSWKPA